MSKPSEFPIRIFGDGASSGNPGPGGWGAIIATPDGAILELGGGDPQTTNNRMELMAAIGALERPESLTGPLEFYTDSVYVIRGITQWIWGWRKKGWKTAEGKDVINQDLWKRLSAAVARREKSAPIQWKYVRGHRGVPGNERVDEIAVGFSKGRPPALYRGPLLKYPIAIHDLPPDEPIPENRPSAAKPARAHSYLSVIGSVPMRHEDWASCEQRTKGQSGARFKKAMTPDDEIAILKSWGFAPNSLKKS